MTEKKTSTLHLVYLIFAIIISFLGLNYNSFAVLSVILVPIALSIVIYCYGFWDSLYYGLAVVLFNTASCYSLNPEMIPAAIVYSVFLCTIGTIIGINHVKKMSFENLFINLSIFYTLCITCIFAALKFLFNVNISGVFRTYFVEMYTLFFETIKVYYPQVISSLSIPEYELFNTFYSVLPGLVPFAVITLAMVLSLIQYIFCKGIMNTTFIEKNNFFDGFDKFKLSFISAIFFGLSFLINNSAINDKLSMVALNVFMIICVLYILESSSIIYFSLKKSIVSRRIRVIVFVGIVIISLVVSGFFPVLNIFNVFVLVGLTDSIFNYRKLGDNNEEDEE